jgi:uncharacterized RDD family membrane protein YckC
LNDPTLSDRRQKRRYLRATPGSSPRRLLATVIDGFVPSLALFILFKIGLITFSLSAEQAPLLPTDQFLSQWYRAPSSIWILPAYWMLLWTASSLLFLGTVRSTIGKSLMGLRLRQKDGKLASGRRRILRIITSWIILPTLGLGYLWIWVNPEKRGWHDLLSGTYLVRDLPQQTKT